MDGTERKREKEGEHELNNGKAGKILAGSMNLTGARGLSIGTEGWWHCSVHWLYLRMCTWEHTTGDILHVQEYGQLTMALQHKDISSVLAGGINIWNLEG